MIKRTPYTACPLCSSETMVLIGSYDCSKHSLWRLGVPDHMSWMTCLDCHHVFTEGYFDEEAMKFIMANTHNNQIVQVDENQRFVSSIMVERVTTSAIDGKPIWMDVGFGSGALVMTAAEFGYDAIGIDLRPDNVSAMHNLGYPARSQTIEEYADTVTGSEGSISVISMMDVLEHMPFPRPALEAAHELLVPGGTLVISCPNTDTAVWRSLDNAGQNPYWFEIEHFHNFTRKSLSLLLEAHGFSPTSYHVSPRYKAGMEIIAVKRDH